MKVQTVLGPVEPDKLGRTLTHEHFSLDFSHFYRPPPPHLEDRFNDGITLQNVGFVRQMPYSSKYNIKFNGVDTDTAVYNDVMAYKKYGGGTIVENTTFGLGPDLKLMKRISSESGVHIVAGTGYYIGDMQDAATLTKTKESLYERMLTDLTVGFAADPTVKAGFMGEIASVWPIKDFEKRVIEAVGELQEELGCGVTFHPHRERDAPFHIMRHYLEAGGKADKAIMSHLDRTLLDDKSVLEFSDLGCYCQWDLFGVEVSHYQLHSPTDMPSDIQRIAKVKLLVDQGKANRVMLSHDIHTKHRLMDFGGHGYSHIINNILPKMKERGISQEDIDQISIKNPADWLKYNLK